MMITDRTLDIFTSEMSFVTVGAVSPAPPGRQCAAVMLPAAMQNRARLPFE